MASTGNASIQNDKNVTKKHLVDQITRRTSLSRHDVQAVVQGVFDEVIDAVGQGKRIEIRDFGVFEVKSRAARTAQNPKTLEPVPVPPKLAVRFKPGRLMKAALEIEAAPVPISSVEPSLNGHAHAGDESPMVEVPARERVPVGAGRG